MEFEHGGPGAQSARFVDQGGGGGTLIGIVLAAIVLMVTFGSFVAAGLPLISALLAGGSAIGVITFLNHVVDTPDFATLLAELIGLGVGIDYALFVVTRFRSEVRRGLHHGGSPSCASAQSSLPALRPLRATRASRVSGLLDQGAPSADATCA